MKYTKPELISFSNSVAAIQANLAKIRTIHDNDNLSPMTASAAYPADE